MKIFPAIDLLGGKAVRLYKGDYNQVTVYSDNPVDIAKDFEKKGAICIHLVDLEGARDGNTPNLETVKRIVNETSLFSEIGGGIRNMQTVRAYLENGVDRVILGTAAVNDEEFLKSALKEYGERIAVGVDIKDGKVAIKGWLEKSEYDCYDFCAKMQALGVKTLICTDISKDGAMQGTNRELYKEISSRFSLDITASGGVSSLDDIIALRKLDLYGAIIGKAYYIGAIDLEKAVEIAK
ncbi:MAG: 1-(5-phosphoribosyl)-5-[Clostridia bacterium]|nr:1-(5-phosphoribosyl)-5-[(5-phosphoribosylamino)methylideneamino]imidazole-4-carboxamide isomerase [Clostridia bacterium]